jgi:hypothetical protein
MLSNISLFVKKNQSEIILFVAVLLISFLSFSFGYIIAINQERPALEFHDVVNYQNEAEQ